MTRCAGSGKSGSGRRARYWAGAVAGACSRSVEIWIRAHEAKLTREVVEQLRAWLEELEGRV
jgi:hypothetical protein